MDRGRHLSLGLTMKLQAQHERERVIFMGDPTARFRCSGCFQTWPCDASVLIAALESEPTIDQ